MTNEDYIVRDGGRRDRRCAWRSRAAEEGVAATWVRGKVDITLDVYQDWKAAMAEVSARRTVRRRQQRRHHAGYVDNALRMALGDGGDALRVLESLMPLLAMSKALIVNISSASASSSNCCLQRFEGRGTALSNWRLRAGKVLRCVAVPRWIVPSSKATWWT